MQSRRSVCLGLTGLVIGSGMLAPARLLANMAERKIVVIGAPGVGKTSLLIRDTTGIFPEEIIPTVFDNYSAKVMANGVSYQVGLWDTAGDSDYDRLRPLSYPGTNAFLICYSVERPESLTLARDKFAVEARMAVQNAPLILVACKTDLRSKGQGSVSTEDGRAVAKKISARDFVECSALTGDNVKAVFDVALRATI